MQRAHAQKKKPGAHKKRKRKQIDPFKEQETARKIAEIEAKRQKLIDEVKESLLRKREEKVAIFNAKEEKKARAYLRKLKDAEKQGGEKAMLQV